MKTFLAATAAVVLAASLAVAACTSDDSEPAATTVLANVLEGGACNATSQCAEGLQCGFLIGAACPAPNAKASGTCVAIGSCTPQTWCPCSGPAFTGCNDGKYASEPVSGTTCPAGDGGSSDASTGTGDAAGDAAADALAQTDSGSDAALTSDAANDAPADAGPGATEDAGDASHD